ELEAQAKELEDKAKLLEVKNQEVELASRSVEEKAEQLSLISKYKSEFLANMSHELRTPLNSLLILSKTLEENKEANLSAEQVKFAGTINSAGQDLLALINEILDLSKVEAGKMQVDPKSVQLREVKDYLEQTFKPIAQHKNLEFKVSAEPGTPKHMITDENRLQQILKNLLSNAFKFTESGSVTMTVGLVPKTHRFTMDTLANAKSVISFTVKDTGIGISSDKQRLIFEAFQQADGTTSRKYGGTGLGLTISREIARILGGVIEVQSTPGEGSIFTLFLPQNYMGQDMVRSSVEETVAAPALPENADFTGKNVLVVDDDMRNIFAVTTILESQGMIVSHAENGRQALKSLSMNPDIDLVLMDTMMPEMDGLEAMEAIRKMPEFAHLPIISLTAKAMKGDREHCLAAGASDYITKPVESKHLLSMMHTWLFPEPKIENAEADANADAGPEQTADIVEG
ncbi:MAG: response regulator, partial [Pseudobdellovibrionaceae bacterium]